MSDRGHYCPFLNRSDSRCSRNFSLDRLNNTYDYCFGQYSACSTYLELLVERRVRRIRESVRGGEFSHSDDVPGVVVQLTRHGQDVRAA